MGGLLPGSLVGGGQEGTHGYTSPYSLTPALSWPPRALALPPPWPSTHGTATSCRPQQGPCGAFVIPATSQRVLATKGSSGDGASGWNHPRPRPRSRQSGPPAGRRRRPLGVTRGRRRPGPSRGDADPALAPSPFQNSVVSAACNFTSMADSCASMSGNSTSITVVLICGAGGGFRACVPGRRRGVGARVARSPPGP